MGLSDLPNDATRVIGSVAGIQTLVSLIPQTMFFLLSSLKPAHRIDKLKKAQAVRILLSLPGLWAATQVRMNPSGRLRQGWQCYRRKPLSPGVTSLETSRTLSGPGPPSARGFIAGKWEVPEPAAAEEPFRGMRGTVF